MVKEVALWRIRKNAEIFIEPELVSLACGRNIEGNGRERTDEENMPRK